MNKEIRRCHFCELSEEIPEDQKGKFRVYGRERLTSICPNCYNLIRMIIQELNSKNEKELPLL